LDTGFYHPGARCTVKCARELAGGLLEIRVTDDRRSGDNRPPCGGG